jgi:D-alanyl-D-alanine carboxypeptidase/D-alanyl-D-alanine-endopeptidase (penicillin-binding protein 4)
MWDDEPSSDEMFISPLSANANCVVVRVQPGTAAGDTPVVSIDPPTSSITVENSAKTVTDTVRTPLKISRKWRERSNTVTISGEIMAGGRERKEKLSVLQPEWYALTLFREALAARGITCTGMLADTVPSRATGLFRFERRLDSVVTFMNKESDNLSAENVLRTISANTWGTPGTADGGLAVVKTFLTSCGIDTAQLVIADGSGVSHYNLISPKALVTLLASMYKRTNIFPAWYYSLPIAGEDGTLTTRMRGTPAGSNLRAKTGTLSNVTTLSGFVRGADGNMLAFSIMVEGFPGENRSYRRVQDRIGAYLARLRRSSM